MSSVYFSLVLFITLMYTELPSWLSRNKLATSQGGREAEAVLNVPKVVLNWTPCWTVIYYPVLRYTIQHSRSQDCTCCYFFVLPVIFCVRLCWAAGNTVIKQLPKCVVTGRLTSELNLKYPLHSANELLSLFGLLFPLWKTFCLVLMRCLFASNL